MIGNLLSMLVSADGKSMTAATATAPTASADASDVAAPSGGFADLLATFQGNGSAPVATAEPESTMTTMMTMTTMTTMTTMMTPTIATTTTTTGPVDPAKKETAKGKPSGAKPASTLTDAAALLAAAAAALGVGLLQAAPVTDADGVGLPQKTGTVETPILASIPGSTSAQEPAGQPEPIVEAAAGDAKPIVVSPKTSKSTTTTSSMAATAASAGKAGARPRIVATDTDTDTKTSADTKVSARPGLHTIGSLNDANIVITPAKASPGLTPAVTEAGTSAKRLDGTTPAVVADPADASDAVTKLRLSSQPKASQTKTTTTGSDGNATASILPPGPTEREARVEPTLPGQPTQRASALDVPDPIDPATAPGQHRADITVGEGDNRIVVSVLANEHQVRVHARTATGDDTSALRAGAEELRGALRKHGLELAYLNAETSSGGSATQGRGSDRGPQRDAPDNQTKPYEQRTTDENRDNRDPASTPRSDVRVLA